MGVFKSISLLMGEDSTSLCKDPTPPPRKSPRRAPLPFFLRGGGSVHRLGLDSLLNEEVTDI